MTKLVIFEFGKGSFKSGFPVTLRIGTDGVEGSTRIPDGFFPPAPDSLTEVTLEEWRQGFEEWIKFVANRAIRAKPQVKEVGINFLEQTKTLENDVKKWLNSQDKRWQKIIKTLSVELNKQDEIRVIIQTDDPNLRRIPWQVWDLFIEHFPKAEFAFSPSQQRTIGITYTPQKLGKVKILVVLGDPLQEGQNQAIDLQSDINAINKLGADVEFLEQSTRQELIDKELIDKLWDKDWQIIFYSGHSISEKDGSKGYLQLRKDEIITIDDLKESFRELITKGLQLAIFISCDGLGIAKQLEELYLPCVIVMRETIPDQVAQMFLQDFLNAFAGGDGDRSLHDSVREARKKLKDKWEDRYPGISWLPVICQQCADAKPLTFQNLQRTNRLQKLRRNPVVSNAGKLLKSGLSHLNQVVAIVIKLGKEILGQIDIPSQIPRIKEAFVNIDLRLNYYLLLQTSYDCHYFNGLKCQMDNNHDWAIYHFTLAIMKNPLPKYYYRRGLSYFKRGNTLDKNKAELGNLPPIGQLAQNITSDNTSALNDINIALELKPNNWASLFLKYQIETLT